MRIRRCAIVLIEPRESLSFDMQSLLSGGDGIAVQGHLLALAPHIAKEIELQPGEVEVLAGLSAENWVALEEAQARFGAASVTALLQHGLLLSDDGSAPELNRRDEQLRATHWWPQAAVAHYFGRWDGISSAEGSRRNGFRSMSELAETLGAPPPHVASKVDADARVPLARSTPTAFDELLDRRVTCRNFDATRPLPLALFAQLLERVFAARGHVQVRPDTTVLKRTSPSGGGLHPVGAYVLARNVDGLASGIYHYHALDHALEPLRACDADTVHATVLRAVAAQEYWAEAHASVVLVARFARNFWKYRRHTKAYRVVLLDAGHLSQTLYLAATEAGLGAFVTAAINETEIEQSLGLDAYAESPVAVCGFGWRAPEKQSVEFDPLARIWPPVAAADTE